jgi:hypothetical protein
VHFVMVSLARRSNANECHSLYPLQATIDTGPISSFRVVGNKAFVGLERGTVHSFQISTQNLYYAIAKY